MMITKEELLKYLHYEPETGEFTWKTRDKDIWSGSPERFRKTWNKRYAGKPVRNVDAYGYLVINVAGHVIKAHRAVFLIEHGYLPEEVDHIDGNRSKNHHTNLRPASGSQNRWNSGKRYNNKSGWKGVCWNKVRGKWHAQININKRRKTIGYFDDVKEAAEAYIFAALDLHGEYARIE